MCFVGHRGCRRAVLACHPAARLREYEASRTREDSAGCGSALLTPTSYVDTLYTTFRPVDAKLVLDRLKIWMDAHTDQAIVVLSLVVGSWLVGDSLFLLVTA
jgi:hypothetical protein